MTHPWFLAGSLPRVIAHRGLVAHGEQFVENSLASVAAAHAAGVRYVESDCRVTRDGVVVLFHDADLRRVAGDSRAVAEMSHQELSAVMESRGGLMTVQDALHGFPTLRFNLDVKVESAAAPLGRVIAPHADRVLIASFSDRRRRVTQEAAEHARPGALPAASAGTATVARAVFYARIQAAAAFGRTVRGIDALQIPEKQGSLPVLGPRLIELAHQYGVEVHVWTVNATEDMRRLVALGVDGIVTDRADTALRVLTPREPMR